MRPSTFLSEDLRTDATDTAVADASAPDISIEPPISPWDGWVEVYLEWHTGILQGDGEFYRSLADANPGFIVELGCGDGRMFSDVEPDLGLDTSAAMLERAAKHPGNVEVGYGDLLNYSLTEPATFCFAAFNVLTHLPSRSAQAEALANVRANTAPGGVFAFDAMSTTIEEIKRRNATLGLSHRTDDWVILTSTHWVGPDSEMVWHGIVDRLDAEGVVTGRRYMPEITTIPRTPAEWTQMATDAGWVVENHVAGFTTDEPPADTGWQVLVLRNPELPKL